MGFIGNLLGIGGSGMNYKAQEGANSDQLNHAYANTNTGIDQQNAFMQALAGQNQNVFGQQAALSNQLMDMAQGGGPNPALAQLNQATAQNVQNQAALMASQRGASANPALIARQAAMQGAQAQQQAAGQAATMRAQQQLGAIGAAQNQQQSMIGQQQAAQMGFNQAAQGQQNNLMGALANQNNTNSQVQAQNAKNQGGLFGGLLGGVGSLIGLPLAHGGMVPDDGPQSYVAKYFSGGVVDGGQAPVSGDSYKNDTVPAMLSPGEIVIPRSISMSENAPEKAAAFVAQVRAKKGMMNK